MNIKSIDYKKIMIINILPFIIFFYIFNKFAEAFYFSIGGNFFEKVQSFGVIIKTINKHPQINLDKRCLITALISALIFQLTLHIRSTNKKKYRIGIEHGSARWGTKKDISPFIDKETDNNILFSASEKLTMKNRVKPPENGRNKNVSIIGGSGSGKTRFYIKPNLLQCHSSYVITDPKGTLLPEMGEMFIKNGYKIKVLNTIEFAKSMKYNPFAYIKDEKDILKLVSTIIENTQGAGEKQDFWVKAEKLYYQALIGYIFYEAPKEEQNISTLTAFIDASEVRENDEKFKNAVDIIFDDLEKENPNHYALRQYKKYKLAAGKTAKSILVSCGARLAPFDIEEVRNLTMEDDLKLEELGEEKTAFFVIISDTDKTFNFLVAMMYTQMFDFLCYIADTKHKGSLPIHVRCMLDEFANIGKIPDFEYLIATIRSRNISANIVLQTKSQLKAIYKEHTDTILGNCDCNIFLGGAEKTTLKDLSESLGKETIDIRNRSKTTGQSDSFSDQDQKLGKSLMTEDEIAVMSRKKCIVQLNGVRPFFSDKIDLENHKRYKQTADYDDANYFNIEEYLEKVKNNNLTLKSNDEIYIFDVN